MKKTPLTVATISTIIVTLLFGSPLKADVVISQYGEMLTGKIIQTNQDGVDIQTRSGKVHWPASMVNEIRKESDEPTTNRIPSWVKIISQLTTNEWASDFKQIPATVIDNGTLQNVPYASFRCNSDGYEINVYGDLENPACVEIGAVGYNVKRSEAKTNCMNFISQILTREADRDLAETLHFDKKDLRKYYGLTFEVSLPDEPDAYGGWWISVYDEKALDDARASGAELAGLTQPKKKPAVERQVQNYNWNQNDISTYARTPANKQPNDGDVYVHGYTKKNGHYVAGYTRHGR